MRPKASGIVAVTRRAMEAWHAAERRHRHALETALEARREMDALERIIDPAAPPPPPKAA